MLQALRAEGVGYVFGNPGTSEIPLFEALLDAPEVEYVLCLHEAVAVSMADGYAHASGRVGVVNLHVAPGLGNAIGSIYAAWRGRTPLVVTAGAPDARMRLREPLCPLWFAEESLALTQKRKTAGRVRASSRGKANE